MKSRKFILRMHEIIILLIFKVVYDSICMLWKKCQSIQIVHEHFSHKNRLLRLQEDLDRL